MRPAWAGPDGDSLATAPPAGVGRRSPARRGRGPMQKAIAALAAAVIALAGARAGEVRGVVRFEGAPPPSRHLPVTKDQRTCGEEVPDEGLVVAGGKLANVIVTVRGAP